MTIKYFLFFLILLAGEVKASSEQCMQLFEGSTKAKSQALFGLAVKSEKIELPSDDEVKVQEMLGIHPGALMSEVTKNYRRLVLKYHPDRTKNLEESKVFTNFLKTLLKVYKEFKTESEIYFFENKNDVVDVLDILSEMNSSELFKTLSGLLEKQVRVFGWDLEQFEKARLFYNKFKFWFEEKLDNSSPQELNRIAERVSQEISGGQSAIILSAWFSSPRSLQRFDLLEKLVVTPKNDVKDRRGEVGRLAVMFALSVDHWAVSVQARGLLKRLLDELPFYYDAHDFSVIDLMGRDVLSQLAWRKAIESDQEFFIAYENAISRYLKQSWIYGLPNSDNSEFISSWLSWPHSVMFSDKIAEIWKHSVTQVMKAFLRDAHHRDSGLFWEYFDKFLPYGFHNVRHNRRNNDPDLLFELNGPYFSIAESKRGIEVLKALHNLVLHDWYNKQNEVIFLARLISSPKWISNPIAAEIMQDLISTSLIKSFMKDSRHWPSEITKVLSGWVNHPQGPALLVQSLKHFHEKYRFDVSSVGSNATIGYLESEINLEVFNNKSSSIWLSNPMISDYINFKFTSKYYGSSSLFMADYLKRPELQNHAMLPIWQKALTIKDPEKLEKFFDAHGMKN